jgi:pyruvate formate lyase activating enzyme
MMTFNLLTDVCLETRPAYFLTAFGRPVENMAIISFGSCNLNCPYCKRAGQFRDENGKTIKLRETNWTTLQKLIDNAIQQGKRIRLSGGDPCMYPDESLHIAKYILNTYGQKVSVAHNGTSLKYVERMAKYVEYVAIDFKGGYPETYSKRAAISELQAAKYINETKKIIEFCANCNILIDIRTCVFNDTEWSELQKIADFINSLNASNVFWTLRQYSLVPTCDLLPIELGKLQSIAMKLNNNYPLIKIGIRSKWLGSNFYILQQSKQQKNRKDVVVCFIVKNCTGLA